MKGREALDEALKEVYAGRRNAWLFLDYDGTLAGFAPTPDDVILEGELVRLIESLEMRPKLRIAIISGRRLDIVEALLPVSGIWLAGTYGLELQSPAGHTLLRVDYSALRPSIEVLKQRWAGLLKGRDRFYLEDKGIALAIHARYADAQEALSVITTARGLADGLLDNDFILKGDRNLLEFRPAAANKADAVNYLMDTFPFQDALPVYAGDDDKDEEAFVEINRRGGITVLVAAEPRSSQAKYRLPDPITVREWLGRFLG